jgi:O-antigen/teichoic acid export membrane protein
MKANRGVNSIAFLNILSVFILQGIAFISTPIFSRMLGTKQYGQYSVFNSWVTIVTCFMGSGMSAAIGTAKYHFKDEYERFRSSILLFSVLISIFECAIFVALFSIVHSIIHMGVLTISYIAVLSLSHYVVGFAQNSYIYEKKALHNFFLSVATAITTTGLSIWLVWKAPSNERYMGRVYGMMIPYIIISIIVLVIFLVHQDISFERKYLLFGFQVGFPIVFHSLSQTLLAQSDRVMMQLMNISDSTIGIYSLFYTLSSVLTVLLNALNNAWCPFYYDNLSKNEYDIIRKKINNYIELFSVLTFGFLMLSPEVSMLMGDSSYYSGKGIIPILTTAVFFTFMYQFPVNYEFYNKKTNIIAAGTVGAAVCNIILNAILIPSYGMFGAALATSISYFALFVVHYVIVQHLKGIRKYHTNIRVFIPALLFVGGGILLFYCFTESWLIRWAIGVVVGLGELIRIIRRRSIF